MPPKNSVTRVTFEHCSTGGGNNGGDMVIVFILAAALCAMVWGATHADQTAHAVVGIVAFAARHLKFVP